jgi:hypothetical protein
MKKTSLCLTVIALATSAIDAQAALYYRGSGMIYDSAQDVTWLQDGNHAKTSGYSASGEMTWDQAAAWAAQLTYGGHSDWRLPSAGLSGNNGFSYDGSTNTGYNNTASEIGHLFAELNNIAACNSAGVCGQAGSGFIHATFADADTAQNISFANIQNAIYWQAEQFKFDDAYSWSFSGSGFQDKEFAFNQNGFYAWAVHDGDIAAVPVPASLWLFGSSLFGLVATAKRRVAGK